MRGIRPLQARRESPWESVPEQTASANADGVASAAALDVLTPESRACIDLFYTSGLSYAEIAKTLGTTPASVKARLHRAKAVLREEMADMAPPERSAFTESVLDKLNSCRASVPRTGCALPRI